VACSRCGALLFDRIRSRTFAEPLIDLDEDRHLKAVIWGWLREMERR
jgi:hypothetical protein